MPETSAEGNKIRGKKKALRRQNAQNAGIPPSDIVQVAGIKQ